VKPQFAKTQLSGLGYLLELFHVREIFFSAGGPLVGEEGLEIWKTYDEAIEFPGDGSLRNFIEVHSTRGGEQVNAVGGPAKMNNL
jgi:hypothetical protein